MGLLYFSMRVFSYCKGAVLRGLLKRQVWWTGIVIYLVMVATAFLGYVLPWGQISFWAGAVITNLFSVVPYVGEEIVHWVWEGLSVSGKATILPSSFSMLNFISGTNMVKS